MVCQYALNELDGIDLIKGFADQVLAYVTAASDYIGRALGIPQDTTPPAS